MEISSGVMFMHGSKILLCYSYNLAVIWNFITPNISLLLRRESANVFSLPFVPIRIKVRVHGT